jgi:hypothetical protein
MTVSVGLKHFCYWLLQFIRRKASAILPSHFCMIRRVVS